jgi:hypothetical protein
LGDFSLHSDNVDCWIPNIYLGTAHSVKLSIQLEWALTRHDGVLSERERERKVRYTQETYFYPMSPAFIGWRIEEHMHASASVRQEPLASRARFSIACG